MRATGGRTPCPRGGEARHQYVVEHCLAADRQVRLWTEQRLPGAWGVTGGVPADRKGVTRQGRVGVPSSSVKPTAKKAPAKKAPVKKAAKKRR